MIEKYFRAGVRVKWRMPAPVYQAMDGAIVDSTSATPPMTYDGLDGQLVDPALRGILHVSTLGLSMRMQIRYAWLDYNLGRTARVPIGPYDVLTGPMSGCLITHWNHRGINFVGHVGTVDDRPVVNKTVKRIFSRAMPMNTRGFNPAGAWGYAESAQLQRSFRTPPSAKVVALVTTRGVFYSILMLGLQIDAREQGIQVGYDWCVGGIKQVEPLGRDALYLELRKLR